MMEATSRVSSDARPPSGASQTLERVVDVSRGNLGQGRKMQNSSLYKSWGLEEWVKIYEVFHCLGE